MTPFFEPSWALSQTISEVRRFKMATCVRKIQVPTGAHRPFQTKLESVYYGRGGTRHAMNPSPHLSSGADISSCCRTAEISAMLVPQTLASSTVKLTLSALLQRRIFAMKTRPYLLAFLAPWRSYMSLRPNRSFPER